MLFYCIMIAFRLQSYCFYLNYANKTEEKCIFCSKKPVFLYNVHVIDGKKTTIYDL